MPLRHVPLVPFCRKRPEDKGAYVLPFMVSSLVGSAVSVVLLKFLERTKLLGLAS